MRNVEVGMCCRGVIVVRVEVGICGVLFLVIWYFYGRFC